MLRFSVESRILIFRIRFIVWVLIGQPSSGTPLEPVQFKQCTSIKLYFMICLSAIFCGILWHFYYFQLSPHKIFYLHWISMLIPWSLQTSNSSLFKRPIYNIICKIFQYFSLFSPELRVRAVQRPSDLTSQPTRLTSCTPPARQPPRAFDPEVINSRSLGSVWTQESVVTDCFLLDLDLDFRLSPWTMSISVLSTRPSSWWM